MITSNVRRGGRPSRVVIHRTSALGQKAGVLTDAVITTDKLATVLDNEIDRAIGPINDMTIVNEALCATLGL